MDTAEQLLRAGVKARMGKRTQRSLARAIGVSDANMSDFLAGKQGLGLDKLAPLAKLLNTTVANLFVVPKSTHLTGPVTPGTGESSSQDMTGDVTDGASTTYLQQQLAERDAELRTLRVALSAHVKQLRETTDNIDQLIGTSRADVRKTTRGKSKAR